MRRICTKVFVRSRTKDNVLELDLKQDIQKKIDRAKERKDIMKSTLMSQ